MKLYLSENYMQIHIKDYTSILFRPDRDDYINVKEDLLQFRARLSWGIKNKRYGETYEALIWIYNKNN